MRSPQFTNTIKELMRIKRRLVKMADGENCDWCKYRLNGAKRSIGDAVDYMVHSNLCELCQKEKKDV